MSNHIISAAKVNWKQVGLFTGLTMILSWLLDFNPLAQVWLRPARPDFLPMPDAHPGGGCYLFAALYFRR